VKPLSSPANHATPAETSGPDVVSHPRRLPELSSRLQLSCLAVVTVAAFALRVFRLTSQGLTLDEGFSAHLGRTTIADFVGTVWGSEFNMVLYYSLLRLWMHIGHSEFVIRLLSVLLATATVPAVYFLAKRLFSDAWTALIASLLLAVHPFHLILSQSARSYSLVILLVTLASLFFVRGLQDPSWGNWMAYPLFAAAAVYAHFFALLVIAAHAVALLFAPKREVPWKHLAIGVTLLIALVVPIAAFWLHHGDTGHVSWVAPLSRQQILYGLYSLTLSKWRSLTYIAAWIIAMAAAIRLSSDGAWPYRFTATWLLLPVMVTLVISRRWPLFVERYLSVCISACVLLAAAGLVILCRRYRWAALALLAVMVFYSASNIRHYFRHPEYVESWREASAYLLSKAQPGDEVVMLAGLGPPTFDYYREQNPRKVPGLLFAASADAPLPAPPPQNVWFVGSVLLTPNWATEAAAFQQAHGGDYCAEPPQPESGSVRVWQFRRCDSAAK
jgi:mannosyltransferase